MRAYIRESEVYAGSRAPRNFESCIAPIVTDDLLYRTNSNNNMLDLATLGSKAESMQMELHACQLGV